MVRRRPREFTKVVVAWVMATYFVGLIVGTIVVILSPDQLYAYLAYIGTPTATAVGFYCWKAKNENINKHKWDYLKKPDGGYYYGGDNAG
jgi:O-antigen/teichoic acid export membrane protein